MDIDQYAHGCCGPPFNLFMRFMVKRWCISETGALQLGFGAANPSYKRDIESNFVIAVNADELIEGLLLIGSCCAGA